MFKALIQQANQIVLGKEQQIKLSICCLLARGHLLIEDLPGMGKTTLSHLIAKLFGLDYTRIQFTSDMLPADIIGVSIFDQKNHEFKFIKGPIFTQLVLADEINRSSARTQSALLEAMEEHQVSIDKKTYPLAQPFFVIATQNPSDQMGTFPLPESQLDRFLIRISLGYPDPKTERIILKNKHKITSLDKIPAFFNLDELLEMQEKVNNIYVSDAIFDIVQEILAISRESQVFTTGLSPRAGLAMLRLAKAWAFMHKRDMVLPDDIEAILLPTIAHRLQPSSHSLFEKLSDAQIMAEFNSVIMA